MKRLVDAYDPAVDGAMPLDAVVERYRALYRYMWHHPRRRQMFRTGAHWMVPDDHDVVNNARAAVVRDVDPGMGHGCAGILPDSTPDDRAAAAYLAARIAYLEYQHQLVEDVSDTDFGCSDTFYAHPDRQHAAPSDDRRAHTTVWHSHVVSGVGVFMLDTRLDRVFNTHGAKFVSRQQVQALHTQLQAWKHDPAVHSVVVASGTPLMVFSEFIATIAHDWENETYPVLDRHANVTVQLLDTIRAGGSKVQLLVGGDLHLYAHTRLRHVPTDWTVDQVITSGISRGSVTLGSTHLMAFETAAQKFSSPAVGDYVAPYDADSYFYNNFVVVQVSSPAAMAQQAASTDAETWWREDAAAAHHAKMGRLDAHPISGPPLRWPWHYTPSGRMRWAVVTRPLETQWQQVQQTMVRHAQLVLALAALVLVTALWAAVGVLRCVCRRAAGWWCSRRGAGKQKRH